MTVLEQIRLENPNLALVPDDELIEQLLDSYTGDLDPNQFVESLTKETPVASPVESPATQTGRRPIGTATDPSDVGFGEAFTSGLKSNWQRTWGPGITYLRGGIAGLMGDEERASQLYEQAAQQDADILARTPYISFEQATKGPDAGIDTFVKFGLYQAGMSLPYTLFGGVGGLAGRALLGQAIGKTAATMTGRTSAFLPTAVQFNLSRQQEQVEAGNLDEVNEATAFAASLPSAVLESALYPVLGKLFGPLSRGRFTQILDSAILGRVAKGSAISGATEAITEIGQQAIERFQAGLPIDNEDAVKEYIEAAAGGAFVGGLFGGAATVAGETVRTVQPKPRETPVEKPVEAPKVEKGVIQDTKVTPEQIDTATEEQVKTEQAKPKNFVVEKQGEKFALKRQDLDTAGNVSSIGTIGTFNTEAEATAEQQKQEDQKNKLTEQTYFTKEAIVKENPTVGNLINELEDVGNTIAPHVQQVYFQKNIALPKGNLSNVKASGGNEFSVVDGWYDRTSDLAAISLIDQSKAVETTAHENFHALQRQINRGYQSGLFLEAEQTALDTFLPGGKVSEIAPSVQRGLGKDVMQRLQERHGENNLSNREMQAYAFGAYTALKAKKKNLAAPNPVIRAFNRLFELVKRAGNVFRKNKINNVNQLFEKARTGEIGKRAKPKEGVEQLRKEALAREDKKELSLTTVKTDKGDIKSIIPNIDPNYGEEIIKTIYNRGITGNRLLKMQVARRRPEQKGEAEDVVLLANNEQQLLSDKEYIIVRDDVTGATARIGDASGRNVSQEYGQAELTRIGKAYARAVERAPGLELALDTVAVRKKPPKIADKPTVKQLGEYFDKKRGKPLDYNVEKDFNKGVENALKEINYQMEQADTGKSWYDETYQKAIDNISEVLPEAKDPAFRDVFTAIVALTSPGSQVYTNFKVASLLANEYAKTGVIPNVNPETGKLIGGPVGQNTKTNLSLANKILEDKGVEGFRDFIFGESTYQELVDIKKASGLYKGKDIVISKQNKTIRNPETNKIEPNVIPNFSIFGPKVTNFFLNLNGSDIKATQDIWFSRFFYRHFTDKIVDDTVKTGLKDSPKNPSDDRAMQRFMDVVKDKAGFTKRDTQAVAWYYEQGLYTDLGVKSIPLDYEKASVRVVKEIKEGKYGQARTKPVREIPQTKVEERATEERKVSANEVRATEESQRKIDDGDVPQFSLSAPEKIFKEISGVANDKVRRKASDFYNQEDLDAGVILPRLKVIGKFGEFKVTKNLVYPKADNTFWLYDKDNNLVGALELSTTEDNVLLLNAISVPTDLQGQGMGTKLLGILNSMADKEGARIQGRIDPFGRKGLNKKQLKSWYEKNGYTVDEGDRISREPKEQKELSVSDKKIDIANKPRSFLTKALNALELPETDTRDFDTENLKDILMSQANDLYYDSRNNLDVEKKSEIDTLSKEKLIENNLEFAVTDKKYGDATQRVLDKINPKRQRRTIAGFWKQYTDNFRVRFQQAVTDQYISVKKYIGEEPYKALTMTYGSSGATESALLYGVPFMDKDGAIDLKADTLGKGLFTRLEKLGADLPDFLAWVASNRAKAIYDRGMEAGLSSRADVLKAIKELSKGKEKKFNQGLKDLQEFNNAFLDIAVKSGYLDPQSRKAWTEVDGFNFYIPFYRLLDDKASNSGPRAAADIVNQKEYPALRGSDLPVNDLLSNLVQNYAFLTEASLKNAAGLKTLEKGATMGVTRQVKFPTKNSVFVRKNGKKVFYEVDEPLVLQSLTALNWNGWQNPAMGTLRTFKRFLTYGVTASPAFRIRNLIRDSVHSVAVGKLKVNPVGNVLEGIKGLSKDKNKQASELRARLGFGGGSIHFGHIYGGDPNATQMLLNRAIDTNTIMSSNGWTTAARKLLGKKLDGGLRWWENVGSFSENVNRAALYKQLRDKGISHFEASYQARDLLNFSRHGANPMVRFLTQSVPFLNARLQGLDKLTRAMGPEQRAQLFAVLGTYSLASIGLYLAYKDDEDFKQREQWDRDTYHWFKIPGTEGAFRIPRPFEVGAIGVIFERMVEQMVDDEVHGSVLAERIYHVITETFAFDVRPQAVTPFIEMYANKDSFTGRPIESMAFKRLPPTERKYAYTSSAYVNTSKLLNLIPFKMVNLSPVQIEHLVQGYFGWVGSTAAAAVSISDYPRQYARFTSTGWDTPLGMGFFKSLPSVQSKYKTQFYDQLQQMNEVFALQRLYESRNEWDKAMTVATDNKNLLMWRTSYTRVQRKIQQINRQIRLIEADKRLSNAEIIDRVRQLNVLKNDIIRALIEQVLDYEKRTGERVRRERWFTL
jgi:hypothetical protein